MSYTVRRYDDPEAFYARIESYLMRHEAAHILPLGIVNTLRQTLARVSADPPYLALAEDEAGEIGAVAVRTPPFDLVLSQAIHAEALEGIARDVYALYSSLPGLISAKSEAAAFAAVWEALAGQHHHVNTEERVYALQQVIPPHGIRGSYRPVEWADLPLLTQWYDDFVAEARPRSITGDSEKLVRQRLESDSMVRGLRLWEVEGMPVSMGGYSGPTPTGIRVGPIYTPPEYRGRGYATALTAALSQELLDQGRARVFLFTDLENPTSNHIYQTQDFRLNMSEWVMKVQNLDF